MTDAMQLAFPMYHYSKNNVAKYYRKIQNQEIL